MFGILMGPRLQHRDLSYMAAVYGFHVAFHCHSNKTRKPELNVSLLSCTYFCIVQ